MGHSPSILSDNTRVWYTVWEAVCCCLPKVPQRQRHRCNWPCENIVFLDPFFRCVLRSSCLCFALAHSALISRTLFVVRRRRRVLV